MDILRTIEKQVLQRLSYSPAIALLGPRQIGKTTLAKKMIGRIPKEALYLDLELPSDFKKIEENPELFFELNKDKCIIIDEIQRALTLIPLLRATIDAHRVPARFILLGSAHPAFLKKSSETLMGRIAYLELFGIHLLEVEEKIPFHTRWLRGGFPLPWRCCTNIPAPSSTSWLPTFYNATDTGIPIADILLSA